jgi:mono/diheme cytochrome c family protein
MTIMASWFAAVGCEPPGKPKPDLIFVRPQDVTDFGQLFARNCTGCHGADGKFGPAPPLNDGLFRALIPESEVLRVIAAGRTGTLMPAFSVRNGGQLTPQQVSILAKGIKSHWGKPASVSPDTPPYMHAPTEGAPNDPETVERGSAVFARACASCHGKKGEGGGFAGRTVGAINDPTFLALVSDQALRRIIITGRPDLEMPDYADSKGRPADFKPLTAGDVSDLVALLADWRKRSSNVAARGD